MRDRPAARLLEKMMPPLDETVRSILGREAPVVGAATNVVSIDVAQLLSSRATSNASLDLDSFERSAELRRDPQIEPLLGLISRTIESTVGVLELPHLRVLILLSQRDHVSVAELATLMKLDTHRLSTLLDSMEASGWIDSGSRARGIGETIAIRLQGQELVETLTQRRQQEIDAILERMTEEARAELALAFNSFAAAAGEAPTSKPRRGIAPRRP